VRPFEEIIKKTLSFSNLDQYFVTGTVLAKGHLWCSARYGKYKEVANVLNDTQERGKKKVTKRWAVENK